MQYVRVRLSESSVANMQQGDTTLHSTDVIFCIHAYHSLYALKNTDVSCEQREIISRTICCGNNQNERTSSELADSSISVPLREIFKSP